MEKNNSFSEKIFSENYIPFLILAGFGFILYFQAFFFDFSYLDDNVLILGNAHLLGSFSNIFRIFQIDPFNSIKELAVYYRPILTLSFMIDYHLGEAAPFIYHFTNVGLHILAACLLFIFLQKLDYRKDLAFLFSLIFLAHPVLTQAVAWIPGRNDSLLAVFVLSSFIFFIKYWREEKIKNLLWSLLFFGLALFTKESAILLWPILFFYLSFIYKKRNREEKMIFGNKFYFWAGALGLSGLWVLLRHYAFLHSIPVTFGNTIKSIYFSLPATVQFVGKIFFPFNLSVLPIMQDTTFLYGIISIILLALLLFFTKTKRWNFILFGLIWFLAFLLPSFIRPDPMSIANFSEHRLYLPIIGIFIILLETDFIKKIDFKKKSALILTGTLLALLCVITLVHSRSFVDQLAFWENAAQNSSHYPLAHRNLGAMEYLNGDLADAEKEYKIALALNPNEEMAHYNLGLIYANENKYTEAETEYQKEIAINPYYDNVYYNLGILYWQEKKYDAAILNWEKTLQINPNYGVAPEILQILQIEK